MPLLQRGGIAAVFPADALLLTGTLGAFIRIRQPIPGKRELFDIGIAGSHRGVCRGRAHAVRRDVPVRVDEPPTDFQGQLFWLGEPLLFKAAAWLTFGHYRRRASR